MKKSDKALQTNYRSYLVINTIGYLGITVHLALIPLFFFLGLHFLAFLNVFSSIMWITGWRANRLGNHDLAITLMVSEVILHTIFVVPAVGWHAGFQYYLFGAIPFSLFNNRFSGTSIILISIGICVTFVVLDAMTHDRPDALALSAGMISIMNYTNTVISFTAMALISFYFRLASITLEQELEKLAHTDSLTGLYNRRRMKEILEIQRSLSARTDLGFALIFVDIDHFKKFNDTYGHGCGDYILCEVAAFMKSHLRHGDALARWGGEEFLIMLPNTDIHGARAIAEKIRRAIAMKRFHLAGQDFSVTMTFGLTLHEEENSIDDSLKLADDALYKGKEAGRNLVMG
jgi:diguanylate cyclase (GGDEF)-like protein